jgi:hypothetical protein
MSRATLLGRVERLSGEALAEATERFALTHNGRTGVDAVQAMDLYFCLNVERVFFVGGLGSVRRRGCAAPGGGRALLDVASCASLTETSLAPACAVVAAQDTRAEVVSGDAYRGAVPDPMRRLAPLLVRQMNEERLEDVARFCESAGVEDATEVSMLWVDRLGFDARAVQPGGRVHDVRVTFARQVEKEQDAISQLTMLAQQLWEAAPAGRGYVPKPTTEA